jgi:hypothetical protein
LIELPIEQLTQRLFELLIGILIGRIGRVSVADSKHLKATHHNFVSASLADDF